MRTLPRIHGRTRIPTLPLSGSYVSDYSESKTNMFVLTGGRRESRELKLHALLPLLPPVSSSWYLLFAAGEPLVSERSLRKNGRSLSLNIMSLCALRAFLSQFIPDQATADYTDHSDKKGRHDGFYPCSSVKSVVERLGSVQPDLKREARRDRGEIALPFAFSAASAFQTPASFLRIFVPFCGHCRF